MSKPPKNTTVKICVVCGDRANGYNFNAISCESCKAFFRRNALRKKVFKCTFNNQCDINTVSRKFCQKCRLQKCFTKGMNKNLILTDEEKQLMKSKAQEREKRTCCNTEANTNHITTCKSQISNCSSQNSHANFFVQKILNPCLHAQTSVIKTTSQCLERMKTCHQDHCQERQRSELNDKCFLLRNFERIFHHENKPKHSTLANLLASEESPEDCRYQKTVIVSVNRGLNLLEENRIDELRRAFIPVVDPCMQEFPECIGHSDLLRIIEMSVRRLIKTMKRIECFRSLCQRDQIALMKANCTQISMLRSVRGYNFEDQTWTYNKNGGNSRCVVNLNLFKASKTYERHKNFLKILSEEWESDNDILNLLSVIILFSADRPDIIHKQMVAFEYQSHKYLLRRYLDVKYNSKLESSKKFIKLMHILQELNYLNEESIRWHLETDPQEIGPLLIEIFDINN